MSVAAISHNSNLITNSVYASSQAKDSMKRISTGTILPKDAPASLAISERMRSLISGTTMAQSNISSQISMHQTAQAYGQSISNNLARMRNLSIQARGVTNKDDRDMLREEFKILQDEISRITSGDTALGKYNDIYLFQGDTIKLQTGPEQNQTKDIELPDLQVTSQVPAGDSTFGEVIDSKNGLDIMDSNAINDIKAAIDINSKSRATTATYTVVAEENLDALLASEDNSRSSESLIRDTDISKETTNKSNQLIKSDINYALLAQGNNLASNMILNLLTKAI